MRGCDDKLCDGMERLNDIIMAISAVPLLLDIRHASYTNHLQLLPYVMPQACCSPIINLLPSCQMRHPATNKVAATTHTRKPNIVSTQITTMNCGLLMLPPPQIPLLLTSKRARCQLLVEAPASVGTSCHVLFISAFPFLIILQCFMPLQRPHNADA